ncbi:hypothetical protein STEG23_033738, partial [Scotinomys teguina]
MILLSALLILEHDTGERKLVVYSLHEGHRNFVKELPWIVSELKIFLSPKLLHTWEAQHDYDIVCENQIPSELERYMQVTVRTRLKNNQLAEMHTTDRNEVMTVSISNSLGSWSEPESSSCECYCTQFRRKKVYRKRNCSCFGDKKRICCLASQSKQQLGEIIPIEIPLDELSHTCKITLVRRYTEIIFAIYYFPKEGIITYEYSAVLET